MSFVLLALALVLAVHLFVATALAGVVATALPRLQVLLRRLEPRDRAACLFGLGLLPGAGGLFAALGLALPTWLRHEPRGLHEEPGPVLLALALAGAFLVVARLSWALRIQWQTARLVRRFTAEGRALSGLPFEATRLRHEWPVAALAGTLRPRLIFSDSLLRALSPAEFEAVVEHERAHAAVHENLRRLLLRASPDPLALLAAGRRLRADFEAAAEAAADRAACARVSPLLLAGALLKVAELVPEGRRLELAMAALHREGGIAARVRALLAAHDVRGEPAPETSRAAFRAGRAALLVGAAAVVALAAAPHPLLHRILEALVHLA